ncbi:methionyl-tRNA formyltransferase [Phnomibacter ginsenosidimutans]|uniref:Methionyl-tRNA formyltransferase n=2 Tax=Phnomibacter ginsenosidimutans TaxID=2676868 RepID=A0A6I6GHT5_9BACT|nr:methionyl-tRNA formyltransferase [Phnomibacter ginsenosidimutans]
MGTPAFAVASLDALLQAGFNVVAVVTAPDKPAGRGMKLTESAVKQYAVAHRLPVLQPEKLKAPEFIEALQSLQADLQVVVAFRMLPEIVWNMPPMGTINVHGSLLPQYRGAAPINWAVINGEKTTGVTTFKLQHAIDTGNILLQASMPIGDNETAGEVHDRMKNLGAELLVKTVTGLVDGSIHEQPQPTDEGQLKHAPKIFTETCQIDWNHSAASIHNQIRGLSPFPGAITQLHGKMLKVFESSFSTEAHHQTPGSIDSDGKTYIRYAAIDGWVNILTLQMEGKKRMAVADFLRGYRMDQA